MPGEQMMFKDGDVVSPTPRARQEFPRNKFGSGIGTLFHNTDNWVFKYLVYWEGGERAWYNDEHLVLASVDLENK